MKKRIVILIFLMLLSLTCKKEEVSPAHEQFVGGLAPFNDKAKIDSVPLLVSADFLKSKKSSTINRGKPVRDRIPPTVNITSPITGSTAEGIITINALAIDNVGVSSVSFSVNGASLGSDNISPYSASWNATNVPNGTYTITAVARDAANNTASHSVTLIKNVIIVDPPEPGITYEMLTPPVSNQGSEGSCVAFSVGYAARSIHEYYSKGHTSFSTSVNIFSPEFLYNQVKFSEDCNSGTAMQTALEFIMVNGIATWNTMPYEAGNCSTLPSPEQALAAQPYKIEGFNKIYTADTVMIKSMVKQNKAVIISIVVDNLFLAAKTGFIWENTGSGFGFGHSVVITGYNDELQAWKIMNSFGTAWGTNGFAYMKYDMFPTRTGTYCYTIN
jgi:hypothetical protein